MRGLSSASHGLGKGLHAVSGLEKEISLALFGPGKGLSLDGLVMA